MVAVGLWVHALVHAAGSSSEASSFSWLLTRVKTNVTSALLCLIR